MRWQIFATEAAPVTFRCLAAKVWWLWGRDTREGAAHRSSGLYALPDPCPGWWWGRGGLPVHIWLCQSKVCLFIRRKSVCMQSVHLWQLMKTESKELLSILHALLLFLDVFGVYLFISLTKKNQRNNWHKNMGSNVSFLYQMKDKPSRAVMYYTGKGYETDPAVSVNPLIWKTLEQ